MVRISSMFSLLLMMVLLKGMGRLGIGMLV